MTNTIKFARGSMLESSCTEDWGTSLSEAEVLGAAARAGDQRAWEAFVRRHGGRMLSVARRFLRSEEDSHDAVQDAFLSAFRSLDGFADHSALATWLHSIVVNVCLMRLRARASNREVQIDDLLPTFDETGHHCRPVRAWEDQGLARLTRVETLAYVRECIEKLPSPYREVVYMRDIAELDTDQTAQRLGINPGAVKTRLHRARQALRTMLEPVVERINGNAHDWYGLISRSKHSGTKDLQFAE